MAALTFADSHNMVAYLRKSKDNADFADIVDFLNASPIKYALTGIGSGGRLRCQETMGDRPAQTRFERLSIQSNDPPLLGVNTLTSGDDSIKLKELMELCTKLSAKVFDLETTKISQAKEIVNLKKRVKRRSFGEDDASKHGRNDFDDEVFDADMDDKDVEGYAKQVISVAADKVSTDTKVNTASAPVTTAGISVSAAKLITTISEVVTTAKLNTPPPTTTTVIEDEDLTISQTLTKMRSKKSKARGVVMKEPCETDTGPTGIGSGGRLRCQETMGDRPAQTRFERLSIQSNDLPLLGVNTLGSGDDSIKLKELMELCTKLSAKVFDLETTKTAQAKEIVNLKKRVKRLERKRRNDFNDEVFDADMDDKDVEGYAEQVISVAADKVSTDTKVNTASAPVTTAGISVSAAKLITTISEVVTTAKLNTPPTTTTTVIEDEDLTIAQTLTKMRSEKSKARGVVMKEPCETDTRPTVPP
nr:hypothetical protein [Tanacetum cinerariifolium]